MATGLVPYKQLRAADPLAQALELAGLPTAGGSSRSAPSCRSRRCCWCSSTASRASSSRWRATGCCPQWAAKIHPKYRTPHVTTVVTGIVVALGALFLDENEIYDLTNIGTLSAFAIVCVGVLVLRINDPGRPRPFRVPALSLVATGGAAACLYVMFGLPTQAWERFGIWLADRPGDLLRLRLPPQQAAPKGIEVRG